MTFTPIMSKDFGNCPHLNKRMYHGSKEKVVNLNLSIPHTPTTPDLSQYIPWSKEKVALLKASCMSNKLG